MYRTPSKGPMKYGLHLLSQEDEDEIERRAEAEAARRGISPYDKEFDEIWNRHINDVMFERGVNHPPSAHINTPGPWTENIKARGEEITPPTPTSPITSRQQQDRKKKKAVTLKFSPPPPPTSKKLPTIFEKSKLTKVSPSRTYTKSTPPEATKDAVGQQQRMKDAKTSYDKAIEHLANSRNLKTEIKQGVQTALDRLYALVKDMNKDLMTRGGGNDPASTKDTCCRQVQTETQEQRPVPENKEETGRMKKLEEGQAQLERRMEEQTELLKRSLESMNNLQQVIHECKSGFSEGSSPKPSYASVAAVRQGVKPPTYRTLHSVAITSKDTTDSVEDTLREIRKALNAKEGGVEVERVRKSRDRRVIISCRTTEERDRLTHKLLKDKKHLVAENITNKKPMVMITGVLRIHTDEDLFRALKNQNKQVFEGIEGVDEGMEIAYKMRSRNPNTHRVVLKVTPPIWKRLTDVGTVRIDLQTLQVTDRSPLTQCTICLGFGHGKKLCTESQVMCSHCGGPHTMSECEEHIVGAQPKCKNCVREKRVDTGHNAFSERCPVRAKWDAIVRATVAYE